MDPLCPAVRNLNLLQARVLCTARFTIELIGEKISKIPSFSSISSNIYVVESKGTRPQKLTRSVTIHLFRPKIRRFELISAQHLDLSSHFGCAN